MQLKAHPEAPDNKGWTHVDLRLSQQAPPPPPPPPPEPIPSRADLKFLVQMLGIIFVLCSGIAIGTEISSARVRSADQRADKSEAQYNQAKAAKEAYCAQP